MSAEPCFIDTNVLVYLFDADSLDKQARSRAVLDDFAESAILSTQVLSEFYVAVTRKLGKPLPEDQAQAAFEALCELEVRPVHLNLVKSAIRRSRASQLSYWDALIVETALEAQATVLMTEDLQHGQQFGRLQVVNPFHQMLP